MSGLWVPREFVERERRSTAFAAYQKEHSACPACGKTEGVGHTTAGILEWDPIRDTNRASCGCGWRGIVHDLGPE